MRCMLLLSFVTAGISSNALSRPPTPKQVVLESLRFSVFESRTIAVNASLTGEQGAGQTQLMIKGTVSRPAQEMKVEEQGYANLDMLIENVQTTYCKREYVPAGESEFNAGRNISASMGDYMPAHLRIEISYHLSYHRNSRSATKKTSFVCPNSMRE